MTEPPEESPPEPPPEAIPKPPSGPRLIITVKPDSKVIIKGDIIKIEGYHKGFIDITIPSHSQGVDTENLSSEFAVKRSMSEDELEAQHVHRQLFEGALDSLDSKRF